MDLVTGFNISIKKYMVCVYKSLRIYADHEIRKH